MNLNIPAPLDPGFQPAALLNHRYLATATEPLVIALEGENGRVTRFATKVRPTADEETLRYVERTVKFLLWARGGWRLYLGGPTTVCKRIRVRKFDAEMMSTSYGKKFEVIVTTPGKVPANKEIQISAGGHLKGNRIGFDLGASDYKVSAVIDGHPVFTEETPWEPKTQSDPEYHYRHICSALQRAATHLPRVDAIGGSSAGIIVNNEIRVASRGQHMGALSPKGIPGDH